MPRLSLFTILIFCLFFLGLVSAQEKDIVEKETIVTTAKTDSLSTNQKVDRKAVTEESSNKEGVVKENLDESNVVIIEEKEDSSVSVPEKELIAGNKTESVVVDEINDDEILVEEDDEDIVIEEDDGDDDFLSEDEEGEETIIVDDSKETILKEVAGENQSITTDNIETKDSTIEILDDSRENVSENTVETDDESNVVIEDEEEILPARVARIRSINFAKNQKEYRSPKRAMFLSLLIPGAGQAYAKKYWKTAVFGVVEIALIGLAVKFSKDGDKRRENARNHADSTFKLSKFLKFYNDFEKKFSVETGDSSLFSTDIQQSIFSESQEYYQNKYENITSLSHDVDIRQDFDSDIESKIFVQGWSDCEPGFTVEDGYLPDDGTYSYYYQSYSPDTLWQLNSLNKADSSIVSSSIYGYSRYQSIYSNMLSESNSFHGKKTSMVLLLLLNHIASGIDAFISARGYNDKLLNKESVWRRINLDQQMALTSNGIESRFDIKVRF